MISEENLDCLCDNGFKLSSNGYSCYPFEGTFVLGLETSPEDGK